MGPRNRRSCRSLRPNALDASRRSDIDHRRSESQKDPSPCHTVIALSSEILAFNAIDAFHKLLSEDHVLKAIKGLTIHKEIEQQVMGSTEPAGNKRVLISKDGEAVAEHVVGGAFILYRERIQIDTFIKTVKGQGNAKTEAETIKTRVREILLSEQAAWLGTGWQSHSEINEAWPSPPTSTEAVHRLTYQIQSGIEVSGEG